MAPTPHPCLSRHTNGCDPGAGLCYTLEDNKYWCGCLWGFYESSPHDTATGHKCSAITKAPTAAPTSVPTAAPTAAPTPLPTPVPTVFPTPAPTNPNLVSSLGMGADGTLDRCHGDCDSDAHCKPGFVCHQQHATDPIPGCEGTPAEAMDYCVLPAAATP